MHRKHIYCAGATAAIRHTERLLNSMGFPIVREPGWNVGHILLDIPSFQDGTTLRMGGSIDTLLNSLPKDVVIWGGNLQNPSTDGYQTIDLLSDEYYLAQNAAITADCALQVASPLLTTTWQDSPSLIIGWGRIGKCLSKLLKSMGNDVTVASRNPVSRASLHSMRYTSVDLQNINTLSEKYRIVFNTAPETVIDEKDALKWKHCIKIDLASKKGIAGDDVVWARGLPGIHAPESSGRLIAETFSRLWKEME